MFDPNHIVFNSALFYVVRTEDTDHPIGHRRSLSERFDLRRYRIVWRAGTDHNRTLFSGSLYRTGKK